MSSEAARGAAGARNLPAPLGFGSLMAEAWRIYRAIFVPALVVSFCAFFIATTLQIVTRTVAANTGSRSIAAGLGVLAPLVIYSALGSLTVALVAIAVADHIGGLKPTVRKTVGKARPVNKEMLAAALLAALFTMMLVIALAGIPGLFMSLFFGPPLVAQAITLEGLRLQAAVPRVRELARSNWGRVLAYLFCTALGIGLLQFYAVQLTASVGSAALALAVIIVGILIQALTTAFFAVVSTLTYFDLRARKENMGPDELRAERLGTE
ncbi:MAG: hypothetical protein M3301_01415 [Chloroflexota bacterium]|nr:hypothetical protein [Chloroflexota bacterium]